MLFEKKRRKNRLKEGSKGADVNKGKFVLNIDVLFALYYIIALKADLCVYK